jgi:hypothetical protein
MKVKSYDKFLESNSDEYSIYDWYSDLRHSILTYEETKKWSDQFIGSGVFTKIERKIDEIFSMFEKIDLNMIDDMMVDLYDSVPHNKKKVVTYCILNGDAKSIDDPNTQRKFNGASCFREVKESNKWSVITDLLTDIIRPTLYVNIEGEDLLLRLDKSKFGGKYDMKYSCVNFNWNDYSVDWGGNITSVHKLPSYRTEVLRRYDVKNYVNMRQPGIYIDIDNVSSPYQYFNLQKTEDILDEIVPMIKDYIEDNGVEVEEFMFDNNRGERHYDSNTDIMDYTLKILLKQKRFY